MVVLLAVAAMVCFMACKSETSKTKSEIVGSWAYSGSSYAVVDYHSNGTFSMSTLYGHREGTYIVDGRNVTYVWDDDGSGGTMRLGEDGSLWARDGSTYYKTAD